MPWTTLILLAIAEFMVILDVTVVNVALPSIGRSLHFGGGALQWVVTAYVLFTGGLMLFGGRLADLAGRRRVFLAGLAVFTAASLGSGLAWSPAALIVTRALQGAGAAMLLPSALSILTTTYAGPQRAKALAIWGALGSAGAAAGVLFGGILTQTLGWESVFFINVPVGVVLAAAALHLIPAAAPAHGQRERLDVQGALTLMGGLVSLILAIEGTSSHGWGSAYTLGFAALAAALIARFARVERAVRRPLIAPATWRNRPLVSSAAVMLTATGILVGAFFLNSIYLQRVMGASPIETGLAFLPLTLVILAGAHAAQSLLPRLGSRWTVVAGMLVAASGASLLAAAPAEPSYFANLLPGFLLLGLGIGATFVAVSVAAMADVDHESAGLASGLMTTAHELGAAVGVAVLAAIASAATQGGAVADVVSGYDTGFLVAGNVAAAVALVAALALPSVRPEPGMAHGMH
ncbi:MAG TPA: MFS transporter [Solirubrobacteraceae bacterium]|nr:MFS transporter [Solirubrobacteraceae bacterium]